MGWRMANPCSSRSRRPGPGSRAEPSRVVLKEHVAAGVSSWGLCLLFGDLGECQHQKNLQQNAKQRGVLGCV